MNAGALRLHPEADIVPPSDRQVAAVVGLSDKTVGSVRDELVSTADIPQLDSRLGADGRMNPPYGDGIGEVAPRPAAPAIEAPVLDLEPVAPINEASLPEWARAWRCADCGSRPAAEPVPMLGDLGRAPCPACGAARYFRRAA